MRSLNVDVFDMVPYPDDEEYGDPEQLKQLIINNKVDINTLDEDRSLLCAISISGLTDIVKLLLQKEADPNLHPDQPDASTPLMGAAAAGHLDIVKLLVDAGADVNKVIGGDFALRSAIQAKTLDVFNFLKPLTHLELQRIAESDLQKVLATAKKKRDLDAASLQLIESVRKGRLNWVQEALSQNPDVNAVNEFGYSALRYAAEKGREDLVQVLLKAGADPNQNCQGITPILAGYQSLSVLKLLIKAGADVNSVIDGETALMLIVQHPLGNYESIIRLLVKNGVNLNLKEKYGNTALMLAAYFGHEDIVRILRELGAPEEGLAEIDLIRAAKNNKLSTVENLIASKVNINWQNSQGLTAIHQAAYFGHVDILKVLIAAGANLEIFDSRGSTPLINAVVNGQVSCVELLLQACADVNLANEVDGFRRTPLDWVSSSSASKEVQYQIRELLVASGAATANTL